MKSPTVFQFIDCEIARYGLRCMRSSPRPDWLRVISRRRSSEYRQSNPSSLMFIGDRPKAGKTTLARSSHTRDRLDAGNTNVANSLIGDQPNRDSRTLARSSHCRLLGQNNSCCSSRRGFVQMRAEQPLLAQGSNHSKDQTRSWLWSSAAPQGKTSFESVWW